jgi:two-component system, OmpR family, copper resistance phosphate regulon response regulator CusR
VLSKDNEIHREIGNVSYTGPEGWTVKILIVEDEKKVSDFVRKGLQEEGYVTDAAYNGEDGLGMAADDVYDLVILDIYLPKMDGLTVLKRLREKKISTPVLLLTVRATIEDKVLGLNSGADDYLTKPFAFQELLARVRALLRRRVEVSTSEIKVGDLALDPVRRSVNRGGRKIELTAKEFSLLEFMMRNPERVLTRTAIINHVWNYDFDSETNVVDVYVNYLRRKIDAGDVPKLIHTIRGVGYVLKMEAS